MQSALHVDIRLGVGQRRPASVSQRRCSPAAASALAATRVGRVSGLEFASVTIGQLVWPIILVVFGLILREPIKKLFEASEVKSVKAGPSGIEIAFERRVIEVEEEFGGAVYSRLGTKADIAASEDFRAQMAAVVALSPRAAVLESYARLEHQLREALPPTDEPPITMSDMTEFAVDEGLLGFRDAMVLRELTTLRNSIAHDSEATITSDAARRYARLAADTVDAIRAGHHMQTGGGALPPPD